MADIAKNSSLAEDYFLKGKEVAETAINAVEEAPTSAAAEEVVPGKTEETPAVVESSEAPAAAVEASSKASDAAVEASSEASDAAVEASSEASDAAVESTETAPAAEPAAEEDGGSAESETAGDEAAAEGTREIKLETAPADFRFPTTNQTRHCFTRYVEYHRCIAAKGDDAPECQKFAKYYRALCPGEWVDRWNEQRENGTFPGPL